MSPEQTLPTEMLEATLNPLFLARAIEPEITSSNKLKTMTEDLDELELQDILPKTARGEVPAAAEVLSLIMIRKIYFREMGKISLLSQQDEVDLARQMERGRKSSSELSSKLVWLSRISWSSARYQKQSLTNFYGFLMKPKISKMIQPGKR